MQERNYSRNPTVSKRAEFDYVLYPHNSAVSYFRDVSANVNVFTQTPNKMIKIHKTEQNYKSFICSIHNAESIKYNISDGKNIYLSYQVKLAGKKKKIKI